MKYALWVGMALLIAVATPAPSKAQASAEQETPYWYVSFYSVDWTRTDSLVKLWKMTEPVRALRKRNGEILEWLGLMHHTGNEQNVVMMTKYPSWKAMNASDSAMAQVFPDEAERARINDGFGWVFGGGGHQDVIYGESPGSIMPSADDTTQGALWYASFYEMPWARVDSLNKLNKMTAALSAEGVRTGALLGTIGLVHHTGVHHANVVTLNKYPSWEALERQNSWVSGAFETVEPDSARRAAIFSGYQYVFQGIPHYDVIYGQPTR